MTLEQALRLTNRNMIGFDLILGSGAILAPEATLRVLGHDEPSPDAARLFQRSGPVWLTFAAAHAVAAVRDEPRDWWALAWLRGHRDRDRRPLGRVAGDQPPRRQGRPAPRRRRQPGDGGRLRLVVDEEVRPRGRWRRGCPE